MILFSNDVCGKSDVEEVGFPMLRAPLTVLAFARGLCGVNLEGEGNISAWLWCLSSALPGWDLQQPQQQSWPGQDLLPRKCASCARLGGEGHWNLGSLSTSLLTREPQT